MSVLSIDHQYPFLCCNKRKCSNNNINRGAVIVIVAISDRVVVLGASWRTGNRGVRRDLTPDRGGRDAFAVWQRRSATTLL